jgi:hypothetical protein
MSPSSSRGGRNGRVHLVSCIGSLTRRRDDLKPPAIGYDAQLFIYYLLSFSGGTGVAACLTGSILSSRQDRQDNAYRSLVRLESGSLRPLREASALRFTARTASGGLAAPNAPGSGSRRAARSGAGMPLQALWARLARRASSSRRVPGSQEHTFFLCFCLPLRVLRLLVGRPGGQAIPVRAHTWSSRSGERAGWGSPI